VNCAEITSPQQKGGKENRRAFSFFGPECDRNRIAEIEAAQRSAESRRPQPGTARLKRRRVSGRGGGVEQLLGVFTQQYPQPVHPEDREPRESQQIDRGDDDAEHPSPGLEIEEADAGG
jgi:hypothetical protein